MNSRALTLLSRGFVVAALAAFSLFGYGCGSSSSSSLSAQFTASATPTTTRQVKLQPGIASGAYVVVQAVIYGPDVSLDLYSFNFELKIGNTNVLQFVPDSAVAGNALNSFAGQTVQATAGPDISDPSVIEVSVAKSGGGVGNGIAGASAVVVELTFIAVTPGTSTLSIAGSPAPTAKDHNGVTIGAVTFDGANGSVTAISTGGGPY